MDRSVLPFQHWKCHHSRLLKSNTGSHAWMINTLPLYLIQNLVKFFSFLTFSSLLPQPPPLFTLHKKKLGRPVSISSTCSSILMKKIHDSPFSLERWVTPNEEEHYNTWTTLHSKISCSHRGPTTIYSNSFTLRKKKYTDILIDVCQKIILIC